MAPIQIDERLRELPCSRLAVALQRAAAACTYSDDSKLVSALASLCASCGRLSVDELGSAFASLAEHQPPEPEPELAPAAVPAFGSVPPPDQSQEFKTLLARLAQQDTELAALRAARDDDSEQHTTGEHARELAGNPRP